MIIFELGLTMNTDTEPLLIAKDNQHTYRKKYQEKIETKVRRVETQNQKMKEDMVKQRKDAA